MRNGMTIQTPGTALTFLSLSSLAIPAWCASDAPDKSQYNLLNPTPKALMRELATDRPDKTESAYTVDAGHFQFEMDVVNWSHDRDTSGGGDVRTDTLGIVPLNLKAGLFNWLDLQVVLDNYTSIRTEDRRTGVKNTESGFGDVTTRLKMNLWGNDGGTTALALMPWVKAPTSSAGVGNGAVEGGLIVPLAISLPAGFGLGIMPEFDFMENGNGDGTHTEFVNTITVSHDIIGNLGGFLEFYSMVSTESGSEWVGTFDVGLTYGFTPNTQLDAGVHIGVTDSADDWNPFLGFSIRF